MEPESQPVPSSAPIDRTLFETELVAIGSFRCARHHPRFADSGPIGQHCFVFPRSAVTIEHEHDRPFVANPNVITFYNRGQRYLRGAISAEGDRCDWFAVQGELACDVVRALDPALAQGPEEPFRRPRGPSDAELYLLQRQVHGLVAAGARVDPLAIEELVVLLLERAVELSLAQASPVRRPVPERAHRDLVHDVERLLSERPTEDLRLSAIARAVGSSVHHLCRAFRGATGMTLHQYRHQLRLRASLEPLQRTDRPLIEIALQQGFSSHSHFTSAFQRLFGAPPSRVRSAGRAAGPSGRSRRATAP